MTAVRYKICVDTYGDPVAKAFHVAPAMKVGCYNVNGTDGVAVYPRNLSARDLDAVFHLTLEVAWRKYHTDAKQSARAAHAAMQKAERNLMLARKALHDLGITTL